MIDSFDRDTAAAAIEAPGTPEERWAAWTELARLPVVRPPSGPVVVVAAHPDDEVLGFGGTMAQLRGDIHLVTVTDGEGSHPHMAPERIASLRAEELKHALGDLRLREHRTHRLRIPDTGVDVHEAELARRLGALLREVGAALCVAPWTGDLHADHEAAGRAAAAAARDTGTPCWHYPVWMWHWASPGDARVPWSAARRLPLPRSVRRRKQAAIQRFASQIAPLGPGENTVILPPAELAHHTRAFEVVFT